MFVGSIVKPLKNPLSLYKSEEWAPLGNEGELILEQSQNSDFTKL
jgi:hypothetical protein